MAKTTDITMTKMKSLKYLIIIIVGLIALSLLIVFRSNMVSSSGDNSENANESSGQATPQDRQVNVEIVPGSAYSTLMTDTGVSTETANEIYEACLEEYDLAQIKAGHSLELIYDKDTNELKKLIYKIDSEDEVATEKKVVDGVSSWEVKVQPINYEVEIITREARVDSSVYQAALDNNIDERAIIELANAFQWSIDFSMDTRVGDSFKFIYEERSLDGEYQMPGQIFAGRYVNDGEVFEVYYFEENEDNKGYFDADGNSVQKMFLKAPVAFKYISSGFTTGSRYVEAFNVSTGHRAIDYAAPLGTPIRSVGDGTVSFASWNGSYGNKVQISHNGTYKTNYAHMSRFAVRVGQKVKQGDIIGYVGSTGFSTGPHLHYEMLKNGVKINPLREVLPPGEPIKEENKARFFEEIKEWQKQLDHNMT